MTNHSADAGKMVDPTSAEWRAEMRRTWEERRMASGWAIYEDMLALLDAYEAALVTISLLGNMEHMRAVIAGYDEFAAGDEGKTLAQIDAEIAERKATEARP